MGYGILTSDMRHVGKHVSIEPTRECLNESARTLDAQSAALRLAKAQVAAPPRDKRLQRTAETDRLRVARIMVAQRRFRLAKQEIAGAMAIELQANHQRLVRERGEIHPPSHVDQKRLEIELLAMRLAGEPSLTPLTELLDDPQQLRARHGQNIFRPIRPIGSGNRAGVGQHLKPFGEHGPADPRDSSANVIEPLAAA